VIAGGKGTAADKYRALEAAGVRTVKSPAQLGSAMAQLLSKRVRSKPAPKKAPKKVFKKTLKKLVRKVVRKAPARHR
jgi:succinyl-CoA synthetase alpha subunit